MAEAGRQEPPLWVELAHPANIAYVLLLPVLVTWGMVLVGEEVGAELGTAAWSTFVVSAIIWTRAHRKQRQQAQQQRGKPPPMPPPPSTPAERPSADPDVASPFELCPQGSSNNFFAQTAHPPPNTAATASLLLKSLAVLKEKETRLQTLGQQVSAGKTSALREVAVETQDAVLRVEAAVREMERVRGQLFDAVAAQEAAEKEANAVREEAGKVARARDKAREALEQMEADHEEAEMARSEEAARMESALQAEQRKVAALLKEVEELRTSGRVEFRAAPAGGEVGLLQAKVAQLTSERDAFARQLAEAEETNREEVVGLEDSLTLGVQTEMRLRADVARLEAQTEQLEAALKQRAGEGDATALRREVNDLRGQLRAQQVGETDGWRRQEEEMRRVFLARAVDAAPVTETIQRDKTLLPDQAAAVELISAAHRHLAESVIYTSSLALECAEALEGYIDFTALPCYSTAQSKVREALLPAVRAASEAAATLKTCISEDLPQNNGD